MKTYLATTGLSEIWDRDARLLLLGPWCALNRENNVLVKNSDVYFVPTPWRPALKIKEAYDYSYNIYKQMLPRLSEKLNDVHNLSYPSRYWQVLIGPWLLAFIGIFYERYKRIEKAFEMFPDCYTHILESPDCALASFDTYDFIDGKGLEHSYNFKLFSIILKEFYPEKVKSVNLNLEEKVFSCKPQYDWKMKISSFLMGSRHAKGTIKFTDMYHVSRTDMLLLKLAMRKIDFLDLYPVNNCFPVNTALNNRLREGIRLGGARDKFERLLYKIIPMSIPFSYIENYDFYVKYIDNFKSATLIQAVGSSVGWHFNEYLKIIAAQAMLKGAKLIEFQHGGGYETWLVMSIETISLEKDLFYVWGGSTTLNHEGGKIKYLPSPHLSKIKDSHKQKNNSILFVGTGTRRYHHRFNTVIQPDDMSKYLSDKFCFLRVLDKKLLKKVLYRPYDDLGWGELSLLKHEFPNSLRYLTNRFLVKSMTKVKIVVIDHPCTAYLEALIINAPCVFYWDHDVYLMREEAEKYFDLLRGAGILFKTPQEAAKKVNEIYNNPAVWWRSDIVQRARRDFCERYAKTSRDWKRDWIKEFNC